MGKKEKQRKLRVDKKIQKNNKLLYIIGLIIVCIALFFSVNYYLSRNYVYNIPFTNLDVNGKNPIINANLKNLFILFTSSIYYLITQYYLYHIIIFFAIHFFKKNIFLQFIL